MQWIRSIVREVFGLFVDDGSFAIAVLVWIGLVWVLQRTMHMVRMGGIILFAGLGVILIQSVLCAAQKAMRGSERP